MSLQVITVCVNQTEKRNNTISFAFPLIFWLHPVIPWWVEISRLTPNGCNFLSWMEGKELHFLSAECWLQPGGRHLCFSPPPSKSFCGCRSCECEGWRRWKVCRAAVRSCTVPHWCWVRSTEKHFLLVIEKNPLETETKLDFLHFLHVGKFVILNIWRYHPFPQINNQTIWPWKPRLPKRPFLPSEIFI